MSTPILRTKLYIPPPRPNLVERSRLIDRLNAGGHHQLILISAPAGFGKTTVVSSWIDDLQLTSSDLQRGSLNEHQFVNVGKQPLHERKSPMSPDDHFVNVNSVAWLSLDEGDNDPTRFLTYLIAALQTLVLNDAKGIAPTIGESSLSLLQSPQPPAIDTILTTLLNDITTIQDDFFLVLDDYHVLENKTVDDALIFLLEHLPHQMHLVITTREDPPLPLARLRARGQMTELRAADLRFTPAEAAKFLNQRMGLNLTEEEVVALETRAEGWIAGLQMAALALQGTPSSFQASIDTARFIHAFTGSHRFVLDYLLEEVLERQPEAIRRFLLQTSILDRLSGSLCDTVIGMENPQQDGDEMLEALERSNLFIVPLDNQRHWYRYHHLFADVLQARLLKEQPDQAPILHQRASVWYEQHDLPPQAIHHALAAKDFLRAADLVERVWRAFDRGNQHTKVHTWLEAMPDELIRARPVLSVAYAWALLNRGDFAEAEARLLDAEHGMAITAAKPIELLSTVGSESTGAFTAMAEEVRALPATIAGARAYLAQVLGDVSSSVTHARQALDLLPEDNYVERAIPASLLGLAYWSEGDLAAAYRAFADVRAGFQKAGKITDAIDIGYMLADIQRSQGQLCAAFDSYRQTLQLVLPSTDLSDPLATMEGKPVLPGAANLYVGLSEIYLERGDLAAVKAALQRSEVLGKQVAWADWPHRLRIAQARAQVAQGNLDRALDLLDEAQRVYYNSPLPDVRPIAALKTRVWVRQGRLTEALDWARGQELAIDDELCYLREFEHITLARVLFAQSQHNRGDDSVHQALGLLRRLHQAAEAGERIGSVIEILVLQTLAYTIQGDSSAALVALEQAVTLAEPEGYVHIFVDEGLPMAQLLSAAATAGIQPDYINKLRSAFGSAPPLHAGKASPHPPLSRQSLVEPLGQRELEVLQLIAVGNKNQEIADQLMISLNTVRYHTKNLYGKLGVNKRTQAVAKAQELGLL